VKVLIICNYLAFCTIQDLSGF